MRRKIDNIATAIRELGDNVLDLLSNDEYYRIKETTEIEFYRIREFLSDLILYGDRNGLHYPVVAEIIIKRMENDEYTVTLYVYYKTTEEKVQRQSRVIEIHGFDYIPVSLLPHLVNDAEVKLTFNYSELQDIQESMHLQVWHSKNQPYNYWLHKKLKSIDKSREQHIRVKIKDMVLYYRSSLYTVSTAGQEQFVCDFLTSHCVGLNQTNHDELLNDGEIVIDIVKDDSNGNVKGDDAV